MGCRQRASLTELIRVVAVSDATTVSITPDLRRSAPGRGAHLHPTAECLDLAERRRAFVRALRVEGAVDTDLIRLLVEARGGTTASSSRSDQLSDDLTEVSARS